MPPIRRPILLSLHHALGRLAEAEAAVQVVRVARVQEPLRVGPRARLDPLADELDTEPSAQYAWLERKSWTASTSIRAGSSSSSMPWPRSRRTARNLA